MSNILHNFLFENFKIRQIKKPLFYNFEFAIRFNLQSELEFGGSLYFQESLSRSIKIFESIFQPEENILLVINSFQIKRKNSEKVTLYLNK